MRHVDRAAEAHRVEAVHEVDADVCYCLGVENEFRRAKASPESTALR
jgi:hypothetical protein